MGRDKNTQTQTQQATATPEDKAMQQLQLNRLQANAPAQQQLDQNMYSAMNTILQGGSLPGNLQGISGITEQQTQAMTQAALRDLYPQFQSAGLMDSGTAIQSATRAAADIRNQNAQFNVSAIQNLFNQALGGSSNLSGQTTAQNQVLGGQLAGLRTITSSGAQYSMNPFVKSFQTSLGSSLGGGTYGGSQFQGGSGSGRIIGMAG